MNPVLAKYEARAAQTNSLVCVGLDTEPSLLPVRFQRERQPQFAFNRWVIEQTHACTAAYKINAAFYEAHGAAGVAEMAATAAWLHEHHPDIVTICDAKRADIGNTNRGYVQAVFDEMGFDAVTLHPYLGSEALAPFLERDDKLNIVLCRTSNPGAAELQDLVVDGRPLWQHVALRVSNKWNARGNCALVVGATWPEEMRVVRALAPQTMLLVPGVGAQGGNVDAVVRAGIDARGGGLMIASSRAIIYAADPKAAAQQLRDEIAAAREVKPHAR